jgi:hypothetical protein
LLIWIIAEKGTSFLFDIENSTLSKCARTSIWIDWNQNSSFDDAGELITVLGDSISCDNQISYRIPITVPNSALAGETRMRIQLRDSYQDVPNSCPIDYVTGTTDLKVNVMEASGLNCLPRVISPYDREILSDTVVEFAWSANNHDVSEWNLKISNADSGDNLPIYFEQSFAGTTTSAQVSQLPHYGENLLVELSWKINDNWFSATTYNKAVDLYCLPTGFSDISYFIDFLYSYNAVNNISYMSGDSPEKGYCHIKSSSIVVVPESTFTLEINESDASECAYTKVWIDWNGDGDFTDAEEEVYASGLPENCNNDNAHSINVDVPSGVSLGMKRMRIRIGNSWLPPLEPCSESSETTTYDIDIEVISTNQSIRLSEKQSTGLQNLKQNSALKLIRIGNKLYINLEKDVKNTDNIHVFFYTIDGRLIKSVKYINSIDIGDISNGIYLLTVKNLNGQISSTKFFKSEQY